MHVPFVNLRSLNARDEGALEEAWRRVLRSGRYILGPETEAFESDFAAWVGSRHCIAVASGLDALRLVLRAWISLGRMKQGDEVVVPANSFIASALAVTDSGLVVRFADVSAETFNIDVDTVSRVVTARTRAVMPVHLYGLVSDVEGVGEYCARHEMLMIEDAAQAHGARVSGRSAGTFGDAGAFSFYPGKNLGAFGDAGCVVTDDARLDERIRALRNYGGVNKYEHLVCGYNSRMSELQAALLGVKLKRVDADNARRREIISRYGEGIRNPAITLPQLPRDARRHVWHLYVVRAQGRESLIRHLESRRIETIVHYPSVIHAQPAYASYARIADTPVAVRLQNEVLSLPLSPVMTNAEVDYVVDALNSWAPQVGTH